MKVDRLSTMNFRNLKDISLEPSDGVTILCGDNAQGKTNVIEAVWLFCGAKSFRGARDSEMVSIGKNFSRLVLDFTSSSLAQKAEITISGGRSAKLNGAKLDSPSDLAGEFRAVVFSPEHLRLVKSGPQERRKFIDTAICGLWPKHAALIASYRETLLQRNALLKDIPRHSELLDTIEIWDDRLSNFGTAIINARIRYLSKLGKKASAIYSGIASLNAGESMTLEYRDSGGTAYGNSTADQIKQELKDKLKNQLKSELEIGYTLTGPHRDDLAILINQLPARLYGSQGQQRSAVLSLKLAEAGVSLDTTGEPPVLLLDDVMSELDPARQDYILNNLERSQVFITCCDTSAFDKLKTGRIIKVKDGSMSIY